MCEVTHNISSPQEPLPEPYLRAYTRVCFCCATVISDTSRSSTQRLSPVQQGWCLRPFSMDCHLQEEMQREAQSIVGERRGPEISALRTEDGRDGVFAWTGGPPRAGQRALLAYNKACGAIRCSSAGSLICNKFLYTDYRWPCERTQAEARTLPPWRRTMLGAPSNLRGPFELTALLPHLSVNFIQAR